MKKRVVTRRRTHVLVVVAALLALAASAAYAATGGVGAGRFAATFDARAVGDPTITACAGLGEKGQKIEARYEGVFTIAGDPPTESNPPNELSLRLSLEALVDRSAGIGTAKGTWQLVNPADRSLVGRGELLAVAKSLEGSDELVLQGLLIGGATPPDPELPAQMLLGNFVASLGDGATFPHLKGTVGDPSVGDPSVGDPSVGDPSVGDPSVGDPTLGAAVLLPRDPC